MASLHDHNCEEHDCSSGFSLYKHIDTPKLFALNEATKGSVKSVFKPWENRLNSSAGQLDSNDDDPELLVFIPFTCDVKIKSIVIVGGADGMSPARMRAFVNRDRIDFSDVHSMKPVQEWKLEESSKGVVEYQTRYSKFQGVTNLILHFSGNYGADITRIYYIGIKGEATEIMRDVIAAVVYELKPTTFDHRVKVDIGANFSHVE